MDNYNQLTNRLKSDNHLSALAALKEAGDVNTYFKRLFDTLLATQLMINLTFNTITGELNGTDDDYVNRDEWEVLSREEAKARWAADKEVYALDIGQNCEFLIQDQADLNGDWVFAFEKNN